jgi:DNA-binding NarL/FixJ family response regulator
MGPLEESTVKVLVVDDYEPFRRFVRSTLAEMQNLKVTGEASDGLEAVRKTEELKPDLIVLDIGLPTLNGIEVARQVRNLRPQCKILFMSQESSAAVAQEAFSLGAMGYVVKAYAERELSAAVEAVCQGRLFLSKGLSGHDPTDVSLAHGPGRRVRKVLPSLESSQGKITHSQ